jgi:PAS domain S-box-containing protein
MHDQDGSPGGGRQPRGWHVRARAWWIASTYLVVGIAWIFFSDRALESVVDPEQVARFGTLKGVLYVVVTAALLLLVMRAVIGHLADSNDQLVEREADLERTSRLYAALTRINQAIVRRSDRDALFGEACAALVDEGGFDTAWVGWHDEEGHRIRPVAVHGEAVDYVRQVEIRTDGGPQSVGPSGRVVRSGESQVFADVSRDPVMDPWRDAVRRYGLRSVASLPIREGGRIRAVLNVYDTEPDRFGEAELALLTEAAADLGHALEVLALDAERDRALDAVAQEQRFSETMIDVMPGVAFFYDSDGQLLRWNRNFEVVTGYDADELGRLDPLTFFARDAREDVLATIERVFTDGHGDVVVPIRHRDGTERSYYFAGSRVDYDGRVCVVGAGVDITERIRAEAELRNVNEHLERTVAERTEELRDALVRAEAADQMKSAFLATMSHELRTPLNSIIGFTGIVLQELAGPLNPEQAKQLGMVRTSARHLLALINDVLDISKIEAGQLEVRREPVDLRAAIEQVLATVGPLAADKGLALEADLGADLGELTADRRRVEQVLLNLLSNAVKFTDEGAVRLAAECVDGDRAVRVRVVDTGIGIAPDDLGELFQPFRQLDSGMTRQHEGTGLGLAICRRLATLMGGTITASSTLGVGSEFVVELPRHGGVGAEPLTFEHPTPHPTPTGAIS